MSQNYFFLTKILKYGFTIQYKLALKKKKKKNQMWCFAQFGTFVQSRMLERLSNVKNMKNVKNTDGEVIVLLKLQTSACNFTKSITPPWVFSPFLNCTNSTKSRKASQIFILPKTLCKNLRSKRYKKKSRQLSFSLVFHLLLDFEQVSSKGTVSN